MLLTIYHQRSGAGSDLSRMIGFRLRANALLGTLGEGPSLSLHCDLEPDQESCEDRSD